MAPTYYSSALADIAIRIADIADIFDIPFHTGDADASFSTIVADQDESTGLLLEGGHTKDEGELARWIAILVCLTLLGVVATWCWGFWAMSVCRHLKRAVKWDEVWPASLFGPKHPKMKRFVAGFLLAMTQVVAATLLPVWGPFYPVYRCYHPLPATRIPTPPPPYNSEESHDAQHPWRDRTLRRSPASNNGRPGFLQRLGVGAATNEPYTQGADFLMTARQRRHLEIQERREAEERVLDEEVASGEQPPPYCTAMDVPALAEPEPVRTPSPNYARPGSDSDNWSDAV